MSGTTKPEMEREIDDLIEQTRHDWHRLKLHLDDSKGEGVSG